MSRSAVLALAALITGAAPAAAAQQEGVVRGRVIDASSGQPVGSATIRVIGTILVAFADDSGSFQLRNVPAGQRRLGVERLGFAPWVADVRVIGGATTEVEIRLEPRPVALGEVVTSVTKRPLGTLESPVSVSVMDSEEILLRAPATIDEAVAYAPGVQFVGGQFNVRGSSGFSRGTNSRVLLLMDGVPANSADAGTINWDMLPLTEVVRIEVMKGAASALYGTSALGGVVNVVTADPPDQPRTRVRLRGGFYHDPPFRSWIWSNRTLGYSSVEASHGRRLGPLGFWVRAGSAIDDGYQENGDSRRTNAAVRLDLRSGADTVRFFGNWARERSGNIVVWCMRGECPDPRRLAFQPLRVPVGDSDDRNRYDKTRLHLTHRGRLGGRLSTFERLSFQRDDWQTDFGPDSIGSVSDRFGGELRLGWEQASRLFLTLGGEGSYSKVDANVFGRHDVTSVATYVQAELGLASWLGLTAGVRGDIQLVDGGSLTDPYTSQLSPRIGAVLTPDRVTRVRASVGRGFRAPSIAELFSATLVGPFLVIPNDALRPESSLAGEVGIQRLLTNWLAVDVAGFIYEYEQLIEPDTTFTGEGVIQIQFGNLPKSMISGVEAIGRISLFADLLKGQVAYTYLHTEDKSTGEPLAYRPKHLLTAAGTIFLAAFELGADYRYASEMERVVFFTDPNLDERVPMRVLDLRLAYHFGRQAIRIVVDNALNYSYTTIERNMEPIRRATVSLDLEF